MDNDRVIKISIGESRNSLNWRQTNLLWSDFVGRKSPGTGAERRVR
nr:MAG TPA: hypothetical protein [Caudoviricetes sp.]